MGRWVDSRHGMVTEQPSPSQEAADSLTPGADNFKTFVHEDTFQAAIISNTKHFYFQHNDIVVPDCRTTPGPANQWWTRLTPSKSKVLISCKRDNHRSQVWSMQLDWSDLTKTWASSWHLPVMIILIILPQTPWSVLYALCTIMSVILLLIFMYIHEYKSYTTSLTYVLCMIYLELLFICQATSILLIVSSPSSSSSSSISGQPAARWVIPSQELWLKSHLSYINNTSANKRALSAESLFLYINPKLISVSIGFIRKYDAAHCIVLI